MRQLEQYVFSALLARHDLSYCQRVKVVDFSTYANGG